MSKHKNYETKRTKFTIGFNNATEAKALKLAQMKDFVCGEWIKNILNSFSSSEIPLLCDDKNMIPGSLIENAIENGYFDLDEYLLSRGKKIVDIKNSNNPVVQISSDEYNQEVVY